MKEFLPRQNALEEFEWLISGVPVLWDRSRIFPHILTEASDPSHIFKIHRGHHPLATDSSRAQWQDLRRLFMESLYSSHRAAYRKLLKAARGLEREDDYLHNIAGVGSDGSLVVLIANGRLEHLGRRLSALGVKRAIMLDNGGSSSVFYYPSGWKKSAVQMVAAPNYRPLGTAFLFIILREGGFSCSSHWDSAR